MPKSTGKQQYGNDSISALKGADRVRKRPGVIFGSDGLEGCEHAVFEILSNAIDEAREGHGDTITITRYEDKSIEVEDFGRGCPVDWNEKEQKFNWELVFCELYAGGKYNNLEGDNYEYSLGLNGLGTCATQYASEYFDALIHRDGFEYSLHFEKGENIGGLQKAPWSGKKTGVSVPLEAGSGCVYRHQHSGRVLPGCTQAPSGGQRRRHLPLPQPSKRQVRDHRLPVSERHCGLCSGAIRRERSHHPRLLADRATGPGPGGQAGL